MSKHFKVWLLVLGNLLALFGIPVGVGYYYFKDQILQENHTAYGIFIVIVVIAVVALFKRMRVALKKQKASVPKATIKWFFALLGTLGLHFIVNFVGTSFIDLLKVIIAMGAGYTVGYAFEIWAVIIDKEYCEEIGVF